MRETNQDQISHNFTSFNFNLNRNEIKNVIDFQ